MAGGHMEMICFLYRSITQESAQGYDSKISTEGALLR